MDKLQIVRPVGKEEPLKAKGAREIVRCNYICQNRAYAYVRKGIDYLTFLFIQFTARSWYWFPRFPSWRRHYFLTMKRHTAPLLPIFVSLSKQRKRERERERERGEGRREKFWILFLYFPFCRFGILHCELFYSFRRKFRGISHGYWILMVMQ